ncbi:hypothetical protein [Clostridium folliculivorans]|uniref:Uncharacterized protein n=1 Tax=Clostridium folliculivorans TaxID=2886038 RepID=A0A9W5Y197_9CLOT|nr:hypothetical protein [Clostridium folliculivorans]GKU24657.1 hypothetical protein CFOLD11_14830 [Clostridium folliculivorans]GKU30755.1 hypothetical protein CFB3_28620 [Clostridium folliculivorans]
MRVTWITSPIIIGYIIITYVKNFRSIFIREALDCYTCSFYFRWTITKEI